MNTDTEGAKESIRINGVSILSRSCYEIKKDPFYETFLTFTKPSFLGLNPRKATQKSFIYILLNQNRSLHDSCNAKIV